MKMKLLDFKYWAGTLYTQKYFSSLLRLFWSCERLGRTYLVFSRDADRSVLGPEGNHGAAKHKRRLNSAPGPAGTAFTLNYPDFGGDLLNQGRKGGGGGQAAPFAAKPARRHPLEASSTFQP